MSEKILSLVDAFEEANDNYWASDAIVPCPEHDDLVTKLGIARNAILAEFEKLNAVREKLVEALQKSNTALSGVSDLCGQGLEVAGWHLNGALEPIDNFIEDHINEDILSEATAALAANAELEGK